MSEGNYRPRHALIALVVLMLATPAAIFGGFCGDNSPAFPVPECRDETNGDEVACDDANAVRLWPDGFRPGNPGEQLPAERDSSQWQSFTIPGANTGHELFQSLDIVDNYLFVVYNAGLQAWNISGSNAEDPDLRAAEDGWRGDFLQFPSSGENDFFTTDVSAVNPTGGGSDVLVAVSAVDGVGLSIWRFTPSATLNQRYQDLGAGTISVRAIEFGGSVYAFSGGITGVFVHDMTRADELGSPCLDDAGSVCPGVFRGQLGTMDSGRQLDIIERGGKVYVAATDGGATGELGLEIWEVADPSAPDGAVLKFSGLNTDSRGPELFEHNGDYYLAAVERDGDRQVKIWNVNGCLDADGCGSLGAPLYSFTPRQVGSAHFLTFSRSNGVSFLYYGVQANGLDRTQVEMLLDLTTLGTTNQITEITDGGGTYTDECSGNTVDYWGDYYPDNGHGLRNTRPRIDKFQDEFFYRAAYGILDVHVRESGPPSITTTVDDAPPFYMDQPIDFSATAQDCPGPEVWTWQDDDTVASSIDANGSAAAVTFGLCAGPDCPDRQVEVWALKDACADDPGLIEDRATLTVMEPRAQIRTVAVCPVTDPLCDQVPDPAFEVGTVLRFNAFLDGQPPFTYQWEAKDDAGMVLASGTDAAFAWDTSGIIVDPPPEVFADGFESGDVIAWSSSVGVPGTEATRGAPPQSPVAPRRSLRELIAEGGGSATFDVELTVTNLGGAAAAMDSLQLTLTAPDP